MPPRQIPLGLLHPAQYGRESFILGASNREAFDVVVSSDDPVVVLSGPEGSGKTHLAHIWAARHGGDMLAAGGLQDWAPGELAAGGAIVVEDIDRADLAETALFHMLNTCREVGARLLVTSRQAAANLPVRLPDLASRLRLARPAALLPPDETLLRPVLVKLFADRQLVVDRAVIDFLLPRIERSFSAVAEIVDELDREALAAGRAITRPMAARLIAEAESRKQRFMEFE